MGAFEEIAVLDLQFKIVAVLATLTFVAVAFPIVIVSGPEVGFPIGALAAALVAYRIAKRLS